MTDVDRDEPSETRRLIALAWPVVLGQLGMMMMGVVDVMMVGGLGDEALGSIALGHTWSFGTMIVALGTAMGLDPVIAQEFGAGNRKAAGVGFLRGMVIVLALAVPVMFLHLHAETGLTALREPAELIPAAASYCRVLTWSVPPMLIYSVTRQFLQGAGRMRPATLAIVAGNVVNVLLNYSLIYGHFGMPALGTVGAAWATLGARVAMAVFLLVAALDLVKECWPDHLGVVFAPRPLLRLCGIGFPVGLQVATEVWAFTGTTILMGWFGKVAVSAHMVALNLASIAFMVPLGVSAAAATRVGNLVGSGAPWSRAGFTAVGLGAGAMAVSASLFLMVPDLLVRAYIREEPVVALAVRLLPAAAAFQLFDGTQVVCFGVLRGAGDTQVPGVANLVGYWLIGLPIGAWLAFQAGFGPIGLWIGLAIGLGVVAVLLLLRLRHTTARGGYRVAS